MHDLTLLEQLDVLKAKAIDDFSRACIVGARHALGDYGNPLRLNFFSTAMRILFEHMMDTLVSSDEVKKCIWFKAERDDGKPTRGQRIIYAIQGGLPDGFVAENLGVDVGPPRKRLLDAVDECSKQVHAREGTIVHDPSEQDAVAMSTIAAAGALLDAMQSCRVTILRQIESSIDAVAVDALLSETILEVDELATHHYIQDIYVERTVVHTIGPETITYRATGTVDVILQFGSNSDIRNDMGAQIPQSFPFACDIEVSLTDLWSLDDADLRYGVDVSKWRDAMMPDDERGEAGDVGY